jgi:hypothetical protein
MIAAIQLAVDALLQERCRALGLSRVDVVRGAGFNNVAKGLRRLEELCAGGLKTTGSLIHCLPAALELRTGVIAAGDVACWDKSGRHILVVTLTGFDPKETWTFHIGLGRAATSPV